MFRDVFHSGIWLHHRIFEWLPGTLTPLSYRSVVQLQDSHLVFSIRKICRLIGIICKLLTILRKLLDLSTAKYHYFFTSYYDFMKLRPYTTFRDSNSIEAECSGKSAEQPTLLSNLSYIYIHLSMYYILNFKKSIFIGFISHFIWLRIFM